jgi:diguanylate cyclase (GGDEF)-like protein/PAS domain S-box-containing protein
VNELTQQPYRVLVVDDDASIRATYRHILQPPPSELGGLEALISGGEAVAEAQLFQVVEADQGEAAAELQRQALAGGLRFPLAFIDMRMPPGWDGMRTAVKLREQDPSIYIVIATAYSDYDVNALQRALGHDVVLLRKPFNQEEVFQLARTLCQSWMTRQRLESVTAEMESRVRRRTIELDQRNELQALLIEIISRFIQANTVNDLDDAVNWSLARLGRAIDVDSCSLFRFDAALDRYRMSHEWHALGTQPLPAALRLIPRGDIAPAHARFLRGELFQFDRRSEPAPEMVALSRLLDGLYDQVLAVPLEIGARLSGFLAIGTARSSAALDPVLVRLLFTVGHAITSAQDALEARHKLNESREMLQRTERISHTGSWEWDMASDSVIWSDEMYRIFGFDPARRAPSLAEHDQLYPAEDMRRLRRAVDAALNQGTPYEIQLQAIRQDGGTRVCLARGYQKRDAEGRVTGLYGTLQDISESHRADQALREERAKLRFILDLAPIGIWMQDGGGKLSFVNQAFCQAMGISEQDFLSAPHYVELIPEAFREQCLASDDKALSGAGVSDNHQRLPFVDGQVHDLRVIKAVRRDAQGAPVALVGLSLDISEELAQQRALRDSEIKFHTMLDWTYDVEYWIAPDGGFIYLTPSVQRITGYAADQFLAAPDLLDSLVHEEDRAEWQRQTRLCRAEQDSGAVREFDARILHRDGRVIWVAQTCRPVFDADGVGMGWRLTLRDIGARKAAEQQIRHLAYYDPLTGLPNRRLLMDRLGHALAGVARGREYGALMILDLDHFKVLNDTQGHDVGDKLLVEVAQRMLACVRQQDTVARLGGDEYVVMLEQLGADEAQAASQAETVAEKVRAALAMPYQLHDPEHEYHSAASIGLTLFGGAAGQDTVEGLLKQADVALYQAKDAGRNTIRFFNPTMQAAIEARTTLENALRRALRHGDLHLHYQPQVDRHGRLIGAEALLRWLPPEGEAIMPAEFIPVAEASGLILPIGKWVFDTACAELKSWASQPAMRALKLAVNVSARQFHQADFVQQIRDSLARSGADPRLLKLELTETAVLANVEESIQRMWELRQMGITFSLDDFGTGYSSLAYLKRLPLDQVKIDQSFIRDISSDPNDAAIVRAILAMSHSLSINVIAEGVETEAQRQFLIDNGCTDFQGFLFGKPLPMHRWAR